jgi:serine protease AprX
MNIGYSTQSAVVRDAHRPWPGKSIAAAACVFSGLLLSGLASSVRADAPVGKADSVLTSRMAAHPVSGWSSVIIRYAGTLTSTQETRLKSLGGTLYRHLPLIHSVALRIPTRNLSRLAALPFVRHLSYDGAVKKLDAFTVSSSGADIAWQRPYNLSGSGVTVAVVDSGTQGITDLNTSGLLGTGLLSSYRVARSVNFVAGTSSTNDTCGHGTHVAGIVAGNGASSKGLTCYRTFYGIAPQANLVSVRVLNNTGEGTLSQVIAGLQWVVANKNAYNIRVINLSLGHPVGESYTTDPLCQAVEAAWKAGIVVVCAAGNDGRLNATQSGTDNEGWGTAYGSIQSPGNDPYVITVGATKSEDGNRADDRIATYSSRGPSRLDLVLKPDIIAPGNQIISLLVNGSYLDTQFSATNQVPWSYYCLSLFGGNSNRYFRLSGTSMASPVVAGAAALMLQANSKLSPDTVKARLMISADKWTFPDGTADPCTFGAGYLNIPAALNCPVVATQYAMSPTLSEDGSGNVYINEDSSIWGSKAIWGTGVNDLRAVWGTMAISDSSLNQINASRAIWGSSVWSDRAIWGSSTDSVDLSVTAIQGEN